MRLPCCMGAGEKCRRRPEAPDALRPVSTTDRTAGSRAPACSRRAATTLGMPSSPLDLGHASLGAESAERES